MFTWIYTLKWIANKTDDQFVLSCPPRAVGRTMIHCDRLLNLDALDCRLDCDILVVISKSLERRFISKRTRESAANFQITITCLHQRTRNKFIFEVVPAIYFTHIFTLRIRDFNMPSHRINIQKNFERRTILWCSIRAT